MLVHLSGELGQWQSRLTPLVDLSAWDLAGTTDVHLNVTRMAEKIEIHSMQGALQQLHAHSPTLGWYIDEPVVQLKGQGEIETDTGRVALRDVGIEANTFSILRRRRRSRSRVAVRWVCWGRSNSPVIWRSCIVGRCDRANRRRSVLPVA